MLPLASLFSLFSSDFMLFGVLAVVATFVGVAAWNKRGELAPLPGESITETVQRDALEVSQILADEGLPLTSGLLKDIATGNMKTAVQHLRQIQGVLRDPMSRSLVIASFLRHQIEKSLADPAKKTQLLSVIEEKTGLRFGGSDDATSA